MSRLANAILTGAATMGYPAPMSDIRLGGQNGYSPNLTQWVNNQAYIPKQLICLLIEAPRGFQYMPDPGFWVGALKSLVELHPKSISGFNAGLEADFAENAVSGGGEMQQDLIDVKRTRTVPSFTFVEKYGRPIQTFLYEWITTLGMDPDSKVATIATLAGSTPTDLMADMSTATMLFFEPDPSFTSVVKAWLTTNMMPKGTGEVTGKRELSAASEAPEFTVEWTGVSSSTLGVRLFAQTILESMAITNANPNLAPAFASMSADVAAQSGYVAGVANAGATAVTSRA